MKAGGTEEQQLADLAGKYTVHVTCSNCGYTGTEYIPKGKPVTSQKCPQCACVTLSKREPLGAIRGGDR